MGTRTCCITLLIFLIPTIPTAFGVGVGSAINTADRLCGAQALNARSAKEFAQLMAKVVHLQEALAVLAAVGAVASAGTALWYLSTARKVRPCITWDRDGRARSARIIPVQPSQRSLLNTGYAPVKAGDRSPVGRKGLRITVGVLLLGACIYAIVTAARANERKNRYQSYVDHAAQVYAFLQDPALKAQIGIRDWAAAAVVIKKAEKVGCIVQMTLSCVGLLVLGQILTTTAQTRGDLRKKEVAAGTALLFTLLSGYLLKPVITAGMRAKANVPSPDSLFASAVS